MNAEARSIGDEALVVMVAGIRPIVEERMRSAYGDDWKRRRGLIDVVGIGSKIHSFDDPRELLNQITERSTWTAVFDPQFPDREAARETRSVAMELRKLSNQLYHHTPAFEARDAWRTVDYVRALLRAVGAIEESEMAAVVALELRAGALLAGDRGPELGRQRVEYLESMLAQTSYVDLGGISPSAGMSVVQVRLEDAYVARTVRPYRPEGEPIPVRTETEEALRALFSDDPKGALTESEIALIHRAILIGGPGAGKSTLLRRVARMACLGLAPLQERTPILIRATRFSEAIADAPSLSLRRFIVQRHLERFGTFLAEELELGRALVLIDGLDEVTDGPLRTRVESAVSTFGIDHPGVGMLVSTRPYGYRPGALGSEYQALDLGAFSDAEVRDFVSRWVQQLRETDSAGDFDWGRGDLISTIDSSPSVQDLSRTPLLLTIIVLLWVRGAGLPSARIELFASATETLLRDWPMRRLGIRLDVPLIRSILEPIAYDVVAGDEEVLGETRLRQRVAAELARRQGMADEQAQSRAGAFLDLVESQSGLLASHGFDRGERRFGFLHRTFAEYLAARHLAERWSNGDLNLAEYLHRPAWAEVLELLFAHVGTWGPTQVSRLLGDLVGLSWPMESQLVGNLRMALRVLANGVVATPDLRDEIVRRAAGVYLDPEHEAVRISIGRALVAAGSAQSLGLEVARVTRDVSDDPSMATRVAVLRFLVEPGADERLRAAIAALDSLLDVSSNPKADEAEVLRAAGAFRDWHPEYLLLGRYENWAIDERDVERLASSGIPIVGVLDLAADPGIAAQYGPHWVLDARAAGEMTVTDLARLADTEVLGTDLSTLPIPYAWHSAHAEAIEEFARANTSVTPGFERLANAFGSQSTTGQDDVAPWLKALAFFVANGQPEVSALATRDLIRWTAVHEVDPAGILARGLDLPVEARVAAITALLEVEDPDLIPVIERLAADDPDERVRTVARRALFAAGMNRSAFAFLTDPSLVVPLETSLLPVSIGQPMLTNLVVERLLEARADALTKAESKTLEEGLRKILEVAPFPVKTGPFSVLADAPWAERAASGLTTHPRPETRAWAARIFRLVWPRSASFDLVELLADQDPTVRSEAVDAARPDDLQGTSSYPALTGFLDLGPDEAVAVLARRMRSTPASADLVDLAEIYLIEHPGSTAGAVFAAGLLLIPEA